jgi:aryl-alcohol dehydrogenase-like predicted oxidoreductase
MAIQGSVTAAAAGTVEIGGDLTVNRLGFGAMRITGPGIWGEPPNREEAKAVLRRAVELEVNFIDTADAYGPEVSENLIAETLYPYPDDLVIATKGGLLRSGPNKWPADGRPEHLKEACEGSLKRLRLDQIPLYQFHRPDPKVPIEESVGALDELKTEGKIRHIGVSNFNEHQLRQAQLVAPIVSIQNQYSVGFRESEDLIGLCETQSIVFIPYRPVLDVSAHQEALIARIAERHQATWAQVVLAWLLARSPAMLPIPGTSTLKHLEENVAAAGLGLTDEEFEAIDQLK